MDWRDRFSKDADAAKASDIRELLKIMAEPDILSFAGGIPDPALFPIEEARIERERIDADEARFKAAMQYSETEGYLPLRQWIAGEMAKIGIACGPEHVLITSGSQQALDYLGKLFLSPGDTALVGWPTYMGALGAFNAYEPRYDRLNIRGNRTAEDYRNAADAAGGAVKFAYLSPDFANPTGETVDRAGREMLLDLADDLDCAIIEDGAYQSLRYDGDPVPPILALELARKGDLEACRTIYCGSFSKTLSPGLRVGWVVAASPVIGQLVLMKQAADLHSATANQIAIHKVAEACFDAHVNKIRAAYSARRDAMLAALVRHMPQGVHWTRPEGGMFVWLTLPRGMDAADLLARAIEEQNLAFVPGRAFHADGTGENTLRLAFSCADAAMIEEGMRRLGALLCDG